MAPLAWHHTDQVSRMACCAERYVLGLTRGSGRLNREGYPLGWGFAIWYDRSNEPIAHAPPPPPQSGGAQAAGHALCSGVPLARRPDGPRLTPRIPSPLSPLLCRPFIRAIAAPFIYFGVLKKNRTFKTKLYCQVWNYVGVIPPLIHRL